MLPNDSDPDGDTLVLQSDHRRLGHGDRSTRSGQVSFTPDPGQPAGTDRAAVHGGRRVRRPTDGHVQVQIRLDGSNNEPDARNDSAVTVVGKPITLNVLANDTDPDGDPLTVAGRADAGVARGRRPEHYEMSLSDGR